MGIEMDIQGWVGEVTLRSVTDRFDWFIAVSLVGNVSPFLVMSTNVLLDLGFVRDKLKKLHQP